MKILVTALLTLIIGGGCVARRAPTTQVQYSTDEFSQYAAQLENAQHIVNTMDILTRNGEAMSMQYVELYCTYTDRIRQIESVQLGEKTANAHYLERLRPLRNIVASTFDGSPLVLPIVDYYIAKVSDISAQGSP